jgi:hypothetical protein
MKWYVVILMLVLIPTAHALIQELQVSTCSAVGCSVAQLNTFNNVSGMTVARNADEQAVLTAASFDDAATVNTADFVFSYDHEAGANGNWQLLFQNATDQTVWCTATITLSTTFTSSTITPASCSWTPQKLKNLEINFDNADTASPQIGFVDFFNATIDYTPPPTPPEIENVSVQNINKYNATVSWDTNNSANATLEYGTTTALGSVQTNTTFGLSRSFFVSSLTPGTQYFYNVTSCTADLCETQGPHNFTTLLPTEPQIENITETNLAKTSIDVSWDTNNSANATIEYGITTSLGTTQTNTTFGFSRSFSLTSLNPDTTYFYNVTSCTVDICEIQGSYNFSTPPPLYPEIENIIETNLGSDSIDISWDTNNSANTTINYGETPSFGSTQTNSKHTAFSENYESLIN